ncbi:MAG TPA: chemotaxis-specific protein-glutamate methyltransferase CheB [Polyangiaceae bacterium]|jgi:two-component system chemotaxis response regulator CheB|nr:chemotaxis-specific protein-glutamate methyltransferase CheB [Polyangiaceae bacterium]
MSAERLRVLVVDDSAHTRRSISDVLEGTAEIDVVGKAADGEEALRLVSSLKPDAITLDLEMPKMDGFTFLRILMVKQPTPVIVVSSYANKENVFKALEFGAIDFVAKPDRQFTEGAIRRELIQKVLLVRQLKAIGVPPALTARPATPAPPVPPSGRFTPAPQPRQIAVPLRHIIAIASSTGGPSALIELLSRLPERLPAAILIAQHMPDKFTKTFAERLDKKGPLRCFEAEDGAPVLARHIYICPGKMCMDLAVVPGTGNGITADLRLHVSAPSPSDRYVPSGDRLFNSVAAVAGTRAVGVILTGMGDDGMHGARAIRAAHGKVIAESEETAVVYGMPGSAVKAGVVDEILPLPMIGNYLTLLGAV